MLRCSQVFFQRSRYFDYKVGYVGQYFEILLRTCEIQAFMPFRHIYKVYRVFQSILCEMAVALAAWAFVVIVFLVAALLFFGTYAVGACCYMPCP